MNKTNLLVLLCVLTSLFYWYVDPVFVKRFLVFRGTAFFQGFFWTPVTALFVHANFVHLIGNMLFLYVFGNTLEDTVGVEKTLGAFLVGGICSFILSAPFYGFDVTMIGASAAIFTLTTVVMLIKPLKFSWIFFMPLGLVAILYFLYNLLAVYYGVGGSVGYIGHVIGFLLGVPFGIALSKGKWLRNVTITLLLLAIYIAIAYLIGPILISYLT